MAETVQGPPCRRCGRTERYARAPKGRKTGACVACKREANGRRYATPENAERTREAARRWLSDPGNTRRNRLNNKRWSTENREAYLEACRRWRRENREKANAYKQRRRARKLRAMPDWLTQQQHDEVESVYAEARWLTEQTSVEHHVDHIVPLKGEEVCGLHVPWNLQALPAEENLRKGNRLKTAPGLTEPHVSRGLSVA